MCAHCAAEVRRQPNAAKSPLRNQSSVKEIFIQNFPSSLSWMSRNEKREKMRGENARKTPDSSQSCSRARAKLMHAYNPLLDEVSHGAKQTKVWEEYKAERTARETENVDDEAAGSDSRCAHREKKAYGKHYPSVWTKDPHGGEYRVDKGPGSRKGYDALEQQSDGRMIERPLGYEKPQTGPTTNFVGNHMTQGAIDLVQYELTKIDPDQEVNRDRLDQARGVQRKPPELISTAKTNQSDKVSKLRTLRGGMPERSFIFKSTGNLYLKQDTEKPVANSMSGASQSKFHASQQVRNLDTHLCCNSEDYMRLFEWESPRLLLHPIIYKWI